MLVLSRKENESVVINRDVKITVLEIRGGRIRIGIEAPQGVSIKRGELPDLVAPCPPPIPFEGSRVDVTQG